MSSWYSWGTSGERREVRADLRNRSGEEGSETVVAVRKASAMKSFTTPFWFISDIIVSLSSVFRLSDNADAKLQCQMKRGKAGSG